MIARVDIVDKSYGDNQLFNGLEFSIEPGEIVGLIGRNGTGKSTLLNMIVGQDKDYDGEVFIKKGITIIASRQEHHDHDHMPVIDYITGDLPEFTRLKHILDSYPETMGTNPGKIQAYSDALDRFAQLGYFEVENDIETAMLEYQVESDSLLGPLKNLSGGQKRLVELVKVQRANSHLALIDEPTNHMDYAAKTSFISWLQDSREAVLVITHDRDVLKNVDKVIELRDGQADIFKGNYDDYLRQNTNNITSEINQYNVVQSRITNLKANVTRFQRLKEKARNPGTISRFKSLEQKSRRELAKLGSQDKPSFWIDKESVQNISNKVTESYEEHKTRNIRISTTQKESRSSHVLVGADNVELSYNDTALFLSVSFQLREGDRLRLHGRNGAGKSTLARQIISAGSNTSTKAKYLAGQITVDESVRIGVYEQELNTEHLKLSLAEAIEAVYTEKLLQISDQAVKRLLNDYLFDPALDGQKSLKQFSGGEKARFQIINMLAGNPNVLILDEPTNHLDLPSIEELDQALTQYHGAILYISHDSYFTNNIGGKTINITSK